MSATVDVRRFDNIDVRDPFGQTVVRWRNAASWSRTIKTTFARIEPWASLARGR